MNWMTKPINLTCEVLTGEAHEKSRCGRPTAFAYQAQRGWMALCKSHAKPHLGHAEPISKLLKAGEKLSNEL